jgi:serine/threonine protein kinase
MNTELFRFHEQITQCKVSEDLFGPLRGGEVELKALFHQFARVAHGDRYQKLDEQKLAHLAFTRLNDLHQQAKDKLLDGTYGKRVTSPKRSLTPPSMRTKKGIYTISSALAGGDVSSVYLGELEGQTPVVVKVSSHPGLNDLLKVESTILTQLNAAAVNTTAYKQFVPNLLDSFSIRVDTDNSVRAVNVFSRVDGLHPLTDVVSQFPLGLDARHFVWIFTRLLSTLSFAHSQGVVHGAILPAHVLINPVTHGIHLVDWCFTVPKNRTIIAMSKGYTSYYAPEVIDKRPATSATDIYMAAMCMAYILGADFGNFPLDPSLHPKFKRLLETCLFKNPSRRPHDAWELLEEVQSIAKEAFGPKKFVKLEMV